MHDEMVEGAPTVDEPVEWPPLEMTCNSTAMTLQWRYPSFSLKMMVMARQATQSSQVRATSPRSM